jgi:hypothetical protein
MPFNNPEEVAAALEQVSSQYLRNVVSVLLKLIADDPSQERYYLSEIEKILQRKVPSAYLGMRTANIPNTTLGLQGFLSSRYNTGSTAQMVHLMHGAQESIAHNPTIIGMKNQLNDPSLSVLQRNAIRARIELAESRLTKTVIERGTDKDTGREMVEALNRVDRLYYDRKKEIDRMGIEPRYFKEYLNNVAGGRTVRGKPVVTIGQLAKAKRVVSSRVKHTKNLARQLYDIKREAYDASRQIAPYVTPELTPREMAMVRRVSRTLIEEMPVFGTTRTEVLRTGLEKVYRFNASLDTGVDQPAFALQSTLFEGLPRTSNDVNIGGNLHKYRMSDVSGKLDLVPIKEVIDPKTAAQDSMRRFLASLVPRVSGEDLNKTSVARAWKDSGLVGKPGERTIRGKPVVSFNQLAAIRRQAAETASRTNQFYIGDTLSSLGLDIDQESTYLPGMPRSLESSPEYLKDGSRLNPLDDPSTGVVFGDGFAPNDPDRNLVPIANAARLSGNRAQVRRIERYLKARGIVMPRGSQDFMQNDILSSIEAVVNQSRINAARLLGNEIVPTGSPLYLQAIDTVFHTAVAPQPRMGSPYGFRSVVKFRGVKPYMRSSFHNIISTNAIDAAIEMQGAHDLAMANLETLDVRAATRIAERMTKNLRGRSLDIGEKYTNVSGTIGDPSTGWIASSTEAFLTSIEADLSANAGGSARKLSLGNAVDMVNEFKAARGMSKKRLIDVMNSGDAAWLFKHVGTELAPEERRKAIKAFGEPLIEKLLAGGVSLDTAYIEDLIREAIEDPDDIMRSIAEASVKHVPGVLKEKLVEEQLRLLGRKKADLYFKLKQAVMPMRKTEIGSAARKFVLSDIGKLLAYDGMGMESVYERHRGLAGFVKQMAGDIEWIADEEMARVIDELNSGRFPATKPKAQNMMFSVIKKFVSTRNPDIDMPAKMVQAIQAAEKGGKGGSSLELYAIMRALIHRWDISHPGQTTIATLSRTAAKQQGSAFSLAMATRDELDSKIARESRPRLIENVAELLNGAGISESGNQRAATLHKIENQFWKAYDTATIESGVDRTIGQDALSALAETRALEAAPDKLKMESVELMMDSYIEAIKSTGGDVNAEVIIKDMTRLIRSKSEYPKWMDRKIREVLRTTINAKLEAQGCEPMRGLGLRQIAFSKRRAIKVVGLPEINNRVAAYISQLANTGDDQNFKDAMTDIVRRVNGRTSTEPYESHEVIMDKVAKEYNLTDTQKRDLEYLKYEIDTSLEDRPGRTLSEITDARGEEFSVVVKEPGLSDEQADTIDEAQDTADSVAEDVARGVDDTAESIDDIEHGRHLVASLGDLDEVDEAVDRYYDTLRGGGLEIQFMAGLESRLRKQPGSGKFKYSTGGRLKVLGLIESNKDYLDEIDLADANIRIRLGQLYEQVIATSGSRSQGKVLSEFFEVPGFTVQEALRTTMMLGEPGKMPTKQDVFIMTGTTNRADEAQQTALYALQIDRREKIIRPVDLDMVQAHISHEGAKFGASSYKNLTEVNKRWVDAGISDDAAVAMAKRINPWLENEKSLKAIDAIKMYAGQSGDITTSQIAARIYEQTGISDIAGNIRRVSTYGDKLTPLMAYELALMARQQGDTVASEALESLLGERKQVDLMKTLTARGKRYAEKTSMNAAREATAPVRDALAGALDTNDVNVTKAIKEAWEGSPSLRTGTYVIAAVAGASAVYSMIKRRGKGNSEVTMGLDRPGSEAITRVSPNDSGYAALQSVGQPEYTPEGLAYGNPNGSSSTINVQDNMRSITSADLNGMMG